MHFLARLTSDFWALQTFHERDGDATHHSAALLRDIFLVRAAESLVTIRAVANLALSPHSWRRIVYSSLVIKEKKTASHSDRYKTNRNFTSSITRSYPYVTRCSSINRPDDLPR